MSYSCKLYRTEIDGKLAAIGIWCHTKDILSVDDEIRMNLLSCEGETMAHSMDPVAIDRYLAVFVERVCPPGVLAAAATLQAWTAGPRTGGIIGSMHQSAPGRGENPERLAADVWCLSYPGGPGIIVNSSLDTAWQLRAYLNRYGHEQPWPTLRKWLLRAGISHYLYVTDGSGGKGMLACGNSGNESLLHL